MFQILKHPTKVGEGKRKKILVYFRYIRGKMFKTSKHQILKLRKEKKKFWN